MCYYARTDYTCGDWKWGNMKLRCPRQHRMGETCGAKLVHNESIEKWPDKCKNCKDIETKQRRRQRELDNIDRWKREGNKFAHSIEKAQKEAQELEETIRYLDQKRPSVVMKMNSQASGLKAGVILPSASNSPPESSRGHGVGQSDQAASRHAVPTQSGYGKPQGYVYGTSRDVRHGSGHSSPAPAAQVSCHASYQQSSASRHAAPYHSGYSHGR